MSHAYRPNWVAKVVSAKTGTYNVSDTGGSGRSYFVQLARSGAVWSAASIREGRGSRALNPSGPTARMLESVIRNQCGIAKVR